MNRFEPVLGHVLFSLNLTLTLGFFWKQNYLRRWCLTIVMTKMQSARKTMIAELLYGLTDDDLKTLLE